MWKVECGGRSLQRRSYFWHKLSSISRENTFVVTVHVRCVCWAKFQCTSHTILVQMYIYHLYLVVCGWYMHNYTTKTQCFHRTIMQDGQVKEAAKACASFGYHNPRNMHIKANMKFYSGQPKVTEEDQKPLEPKLYVSPKNILHFCQKLYIR